MSELLGEKEVWEIVEEAHAGENVSLSDYSLNSRDKHGYLGLHLTLSARAEIGGREVNDSFFVKTFTVPSEGEVDFLGETGLFQKEILLYREVFREFRGCFRGREWCPRYFFSKDRVLVLEDLSVRGYQIYANGAILDEDHLKLVLNAVAALHACSILYERSSGTTLDSRFPACFKEILYDETNTKSPSYMWKKRQTRDLMAAVKFISKYKPEEKEVIMKYLLVAIDKIYPLSKKSKKWLNVMVHGDMWANNLMFLSEKGNPIDCRLVDFQFSRYAPPMHDVMHLLHLTTDKAFRDKMEENLLKFYHESLREKLSSNNLDLNGILPWETFMESRTSYKLLAIIQSLLSMHYLLGGRRVQNESEHGGWSRSEVDAYLTKASPDNVKVLFEDVTYVKRVLPIIYELIDDYILDKDGRVSVEIQCEQSTAENRL